MQYRRFQGAMLVLTAILGCLSAFSQSRALVFQTDFGGKDGAVSAMKGVAFTISPALQQFDLTHEIPPYNIWEAAYRLEQTLPYWPAGTVFVSVVDPGVGSSRKSVVALLKTGQLVVTPDNGTLTLLAEHPGIDSLREIDERSNRRKGSADSYTFHGRDVYAFTGARLASGQIRFSEVGPLLPNRPILLPYQQARSNGNQLSGALPVLDPQYGNVWSNIPLSMLQEAGIRYGDTLQVEIFHQDRSVYKGNLPFVTSFAAVPEGSPLAYVNSLLQLSLGINQRNFAETYHIQSGHEWRITAIHKRH